MQENDPTAAALIQAIHSGDLELLERLLGGNPALATARIEDKKGASCTPLHIATDWPGSFPRSGAVVASLVRAGADPSAPILGCWHSETPLHWAASSDDLEAAEALIAAGADLEAPGASIDGGTPLDDAIGYGCWRVARLLVEHGAKVDKLWQAAALGMMGRIDELSSGPTPTSRGELNDAFWQACQGGQLQAAEYLLARGADVNWIPDYASKTPLDKARDLDTPHEQLLSLLLEKGAKSAHGTDS
ncbi:MAG TPA: ankyrin repeat domain-containing protein [Bryobacteraceae bacterium]|jgi:ankyrin repeat protein